MLRLQFPPLSTDCTSTSYSNSKCPSPASALDVHQVHWAEHPPSTAAAAYAQRQWRKKAFCPMHPFTRNSLDPSPLMRNECDDHELSPWTMKKRVGTPKQRGHNRLATPLITPFRLQPLQGRCYSDAAEDPWRDSSPLQQGSGELYRERFSLEAASTSRPPMAASWTYPGTMGRHPDAGNAGRTRGTPACKLRSVSSLAPIPGKAIGGPPSMYLRGKNIGNVNVVLRPRTTYGGLPLDYRQLPTSTT